MSIDTLAAVVISSYLSVAGDHASLYQGNIEPEFPYAKWDNHPYWDNSEFCDGSVCFDGTLYTHVPLRYNVLENSLVVLTPETRFPIVVDLDKVSFFSMNETTVVKEFGKASILETQKFFVRKEGHFVCVDYDGENVQLLHERLKTKGLDKVLDKYMVHSMVMEDHYYLAFPSGEMREVHNLRSLAKAVPQYASQLKKFSRQNGLQYWGDSRAGSLAASTEELDRLLPPLSEQEKRSLFTTQRAERQLCSLVPYEDDTLRRSARVPDSVFNRIAPVSRVSAFQAYSMGSKVKLEYGDDDVVTESPGIEELNILRESRTLEEVEVLGFRQKIKQEQSGVESFRPQLLRNVPLVMGEADVLKLATLLPGVTTTGEASSGLNVRGGASDQNLILYNGNTIFNPMHMFGLFSTFNPDLIAESELYKGGIPSQYGGRLSSVMNIKGRVPDMQKFQGSVSLGIVSTKAMVDMPLVKDRVSLMVGGRTTYSDWMLKRLPEKSGYKDGTARFWDAGGTLHSRITKQHSLDLNAYFSRDEFSFTPYDLYSYSNMNFSSELKSHFGERLSTHITLGYDQYKYANTNEEVPVEAGRLTFQLGQYFLKGLANYQLTDAHTLNFGFSGQSCEVLPGSYQPVGAESRIVGRELDKDRGFEGAAWVEDSWTVTDALKVVGGLRMNMFKSDKAEMSKSYYDLDARVSLNYQKDENVSYKLGFNTLHQYIHKVSNTVIMSPTDTWMLSNAQIKPQSGWQVSAGYYKQSHDLNYEFSVEAYYKGISDYLTYRNAAQLTMNAHLEKDVIGTQGRAYGVEVQLRKLTGKLNGWVSYTYSRTQLKQQHALDGISINGGRWFSADYDCPHDIKLVANYKFTRRYSTSLNMNYSTGRPFTAPVGLFYNNYENIYVPVYTDRNGYRMPDYFRTDWSVNIEPGHHLTARTHRWFSLGVYNLLGRRNAYSIYVKSEGEEIKAYKLSIFGAPIPYMSYNIKF